MYYAEVQQHQHDRLGFAIFIAAVVHLTLILGLSFKASQAPNYSRQIDVTLATRPATKAPEEAKFIAQADQSGSDDDAQRPALRETAPPPAATSRRDQATAEADPKSTPQLNTRAVAQRRTLRDAPEDSANTPQHSINFEIDQLTEELANLKAELDQQTLALAAEPRVRRLTSVSAKRAVDAAYLHDWRARLEAVGNTYYPDASKRYGIYGSLRLLVVIRKDGSLEQIQILSSSGHAVLDEAAIKIVRRAAPYAPFPAELRATTDKLEIIRTWQFQENELSSG